MPPGSDCYETACMLCGYVQGILFVKHLQKVDDKMKQMAEVAVYFKNFEEAEQLYRKMDRVDLAMAMRMQLGKAQMAAEQTLL